MVLWACPIMRATLKALSPAVRPRLADLYGAVRENVAELGQQATDAIERGGAFFDEALAYPV
jgi:hypothetical protein